MPRPWLPTVAITIPLLAQTQFAVVSVKPADLKIRGPAYHVGPDTFATRGNLKFLIEQAYDISDYQIAEGPAWLPTERFDVQAKADGPVPPAQLRLMLQVLLADRFALKFHRETRTMKGYALEIDKGGPKLPDPKADVPPDSQGVVQMGGGMIWARAATIKNLARALRLELEAPVLDRTKIEGNYDLKLLFEENNRNLEGKDDAPAGSGSIFTALREIGLRLESRKLEIEVVVVDNAEKPSAN